MENNENRENNAPVTYISRNPLLIGDEINLRGENGTVQITHDSLEALYQRNYLPKGVRISYEMIPTDKLVTVKAKLRKRITAFDAARILKAFPDLDPADVSEEITTEAFGQGENAIKAEETAFDRAFLKYLSLPTEIISNDSANTHESTEKDLPEAEDNEERPVELPSAKDENAPKVVTEVKETTATGGQKNTHNELFIKLVKAITKTKMEEGKNKDELLQTLFMKGSEDGITIKDAIQELGGTNSSRALDLLQEFVSAFPKEEKEEETWMTTIQELSRLGYLEVTDKVVIRS